MQGRIRDCLDYNIMQLLRVQSTYFSFSVVYHSSQKSRLYCVQSLACVDSVSVRYAVSSISRSRLLCRMESPSGTDSVMSLLWFVVLGRFRVYRRESASSSSSSQRDAATERRAQRCRWMKMITRVQKIEWKTCCELDKKGRT